MDGGDSPCAGGGGRRGTAAAARRAPPRAENWRGCARDVGSTSVPGCPGSQSKFGAPVRADLACSRAGSPSCADTKCLHSRLVASVMLSPDHALGSR